MTNRMEREPRDPRELELSLQVFLLLMGGALVGALGLIPYLLSLNADQLAELPMPLWAIVALTVVQTMVQAGLATGVGLWLGPRVGLGVPRLRAWLSGEAPLGPYLRSTVPVAVAAGAALGALVALLDGLLFAPQVAELAAALPGAAAPGPLQGFFASFYGGIVEELLLRLGFLTVVVWLGTKVTGAETAGPRLMWGAIIAAAILFGIGHMPAASALVPMTPLMVTRILLLNALPGLLFGWLYWRRGLVAAMIAHFSTDIVLHVLLPLLG